MARRVETALHFSRSSQQHEKLRVGLFRLPSQFALLLTASAAVAIVALSQVTSSSDMSHLFTAYHIDWIALGLTMVAHALSELHVSHITVDDLWSRRLVIRFERKVR